MHIFGASQGCNHTTVLSLISLYKGYKGYFSEWEIQIESGAAYGFILDFCKKYLSEQKFTKKQFIEGLEYFAERVKDIHYHPQIIITSFYELLYDENKDVWIYRASRITEKFYKNSY